jgi:hypothetical protein
MIHERSSLIGNIDINTLCKYCINLHQINLSIFDLSKLKKEEISNELIKI